MLAVSVSPPVPSSSTSISVTVAVLASTVNVNCSITTSASPMNTLPAAIAVPATVNVSGTAPTTVTQLESIGKLAADTTSGAVTVTYELSTRVKHTVAPIVAPTAMSTTISKFSGVPKAVM